MSQVLRRGIQPLSRTRVLPRLGFRAQARYAQIRAAPAEQPAQTDQLPVAGTPSSVESADARFDVVGAPYSLLSVSLSASQNLFTRRGTLVGLSGKADNVVSSLSVLEPFRRAAVGVPFLYQKVSSASPVTALVSVRSPNTSFAVVHLNGSVDWMVAQRRALLAWTGRSLAIRPTVNTGLSMAHWGSSEVTGRGLMALVGTGQLYSIELKKGEQYIAHPSNVVAYTMSSNPPRPYRFKSTTLNLQVPGLKSLPGFIQNAKFFQDVSGSQAWKTTMNVLHRLRTFTRKTIWGDRLFLQFDGPTNILIQTRGPRINDIMTSQEVNEIAETPRGVTRDPSKQESPKPKEEGGFLKGSEKAVNADHAPTRSVDDIAKEVKGDGQHIANITKDGKVAFDKPKPITEDRQFVKDAEEATHNAPAPSRSVEDVTKEVKGDGQKIANITKDGKVVFDKPKAEDEQFLKDADEATHNAPAPSRSVGDVAKEAKGDDQNIANITKDGKVVFDKPEGQKS